MFPLKNDIFIYNNDEKIRIEEIVQMHLSLSRVLVQEPFTGHVLLSEPSDKPSCAMMHPWLISLWAEGALVPIVKQLPIHRRRQGETEVSGAFPLTHTEPDEPDDDDDEGDEEDDTEEDGEGDRVDAVPTSSDSNRRHWLHVCRDVICEGGRLFQVNSRSETCIFMRTVCLCLRFYYVHVSCL